MVKPAAVSNNELNKRLRTQKQKLRLVENDPTKMKPQTKNAVEQQKPDIADDLDEMWDNVPV